jgi:subtilisin family serine protease
VSLRSILESLRTIPRLRQSGRPRRPRRIPYLECLEARTVPSSSPGLEVDSGAWDSHSILVRFQPGTEEALAGTHLGATFSSVPGLRSIQLDAGLDVLKALDAYRADADVLYASPNYIVHALDIPNDPGYTNLWGLNNTGQTGGTPDADIDAAELGFQGNGSTIVAIIDTGIDYTHPDLAANIWTNPGETPGDGIDNDTNGYIDDIHGYDFVNNDGDPMDDHYHGTHVAGTIGGVANNGIGVAGVSWDVQLMAVKFLDAGGGGTLENAVRAVQYVIDNNVPISNNSWGGGGFFQPLYDVIAAAGAQGHLFVAAAGNSGLDADLDPMYPAAYDLDNIVSVAATDHNDLRAGFSNYGATSVDLGAPGVDIYSSFPGGGYGYLSGTSMATPHVAGVAALIHDLHPTWGFDQIKNVLLSTVDPIPALDGVTVSGGRLNAFAAATGTPPPDINGPRVSVSSPSGVAATPVSSLRVTFNEPVLNFDATDIVSFTGPGGSIAIIDVVPLTGGRQFDVTFATQTAEGAYSMVMGPGDIQDAAGNLMDQDRDGNPGEAEDAYTAAFTIDYSPGPDGFGYEGTMVELENIDLIPGQPGVFIILDGVDDSYAAVDLGTNTFAFYGTTYSGSSLYVSSNGLISFGSGDASYTNGDLTTYPSGATIAPLWDDWVTYDGTDIVLGKFEDVNSDGTMDRLIIEWSEIWRYGGSASPATFQAILSLNTSTLADPFVLNYPDIDTGDGAAEGLSATVGIKDAGTQGPNRLLVSMNADSPYFGTGGALRFSVAPDGPALYIDNVSVAEGNSGTATATFTVSLVNPPASGNVTVHWATSNGSATAPGDYQSASGVLTFAPGETTKQVPVQVVGDVLHELDETFFVNLSGASGAVIADSTGTGTIRDDDPFPEIRIDDVSLLEGNKGNTNFTFTVSLSFAYPAAVTVFWSTANGTATGGNNNNSDYRIGSGTLTFNPGQTAQTVTVRVNGDRKVEQDETFSVNLSGATNATIADGVGLGTIRNDDGGGGGGGGPNSVLLSPTGRDPFLGVIQEDGLNFDWGVASTPQGVARRIAGLA